MPHGLCDKACHAGPALPGALLSAWPPQGSLVSQERDLRPRAASPELLLGAVKQGSAPGTGWCEVPQPQVLWLRLLSWAASAARMLEGDRRLPALRHRAEGKRHALWGPPPLKSKADVIGAQTAALPTRSLQHS